MLSPLLHAWNLNLGYAKRLVADLPDNQMVFQPAPHMNHAAWVLGHLACTADMLGAMIGAKAYISAATTMERMEQTTNAVRRTGRTRCRSASES